MSPSCWTIINTFCVIFTIICFFTGVLGSGITPFAIRSFMERIFVSWEFLLISTPFPTSSLFITIEQSWSWIIIFLFWFCIGNFCNCWIIGFCFLILGLCNWIGLNHFFFRFGNFILWLSGFILRLYRLFLRFSNFILSFWFFLRFGGILLRFGLFWQFLGFVDWLGFIFRFDWFLIDFSCFILSSWGESIIFKSVFNFFTNSLVITWGNRSWNGKRFLSGLEMVVVLSSILEWKSQSGKEENDQYWLHWNK